MARAGSVAVRVRRAFRSPALIPPCSAGGGCRGRASRACPGTASSSSRLARTSRSGEPKWLSSARFRTGPTPRSSSSSECGHRLVAAAAVVRDREPVRLVAHPLQQPQGLGVARDRDRLRAAGDEDLLDPLGEPDHGHLVVAALEQGRQRAHARRELALAAVDHDQVGQRGEALVALGVVRREVDPVLQARERGGRAPPRSRRSRRARPSGRRGCESGGSRPSSARRPRRRPSRRPCAGRRCSRRRSPRCAPAGAAAPAPPAARRARRRAAGGGARGAAGPGRGRGSALRSASSRRRRLSPRSATRTSTAPAALGRERLARAPRRARAAPRRRRSAAARTGAAE